MATLEVHDGRGRVERVLIERDQPVLFGSSPKCDVVIDGEGVLPFHGRVRWQEKTGRYKVDASPDASYVLVNGQKMASSSLRQGDEVGVGAGRIFLISEAAPPAAPKAPARDDKTRVQPPAFLAPPAAGEVIRRGSANAARRVLDSDFAPPEDDDQDRAGDPLGAGWDHKSAAARGGRPAATAPADAEPVRGWRAFLRAFSRRADAPGREDVWTSPLVFGLSLAFVALVLAGVQLARVIGARNASRVFDQAAAALEDGDYLNSMRGFEEFLKANPGDPRAGQARVHRAMANVRQHTGATGASWTLALEAERAMLDGVGFEPAFRDDAPELGELVLKTGEALADRARLAADPAALADAESAVGLHGRVLGEASAALVTKSTLPEKIAAGKAAVLKAGVRVKAFAAMDEALKAGSAARVYQQRDGLVARYADQSADRDLVGRMKRANELIRKAVAVDPSGRPAETEPRAEPLGPPTTLVLRAAETGRKDFPGPAPNGPLVYALADGVAYALDGGNGAPVWQVPVGLSSPFPPTPVPGGATVLAFDARHDELVRRDARTGRPLWRQSTDGPVTSPPTVLGNQVIQVTPAGKVLFLDLPTGALRATVDLMTPAAAAPVADESGQSLYVAARRDVLFVLARDPLGCSAVEYLGHAPGSIASPPARLGRYLVVAENHEFNESRWRVFVLSEDGAALAPVQAVPVLGWTWSTPAASGSVVWAAGDRGGVAAYAVGAYTEKDPFRLIARVPPDALPSGPAFALARSDRELWVGSGRSGRYELDNEAGKLRASWTLGDAGPALAAPQTAGSPPVLVLTQQREDGPGVALWGLDPQTGRQVWRTVLGAPWPSPPRVDPAGGGSLTALGVDGRPIPLPKSLLATGGFVAAQLPRPGGFRLPAGSAARVDGPGWTAVAPALGSTRLLARAGGGEFREVRRPAPLGAAPLAWGRDLFVPGDDGRAYLIDPLTGESRAEPFVPPFDRAKPTRWRGAVKLGDDAVALADDSGRVRRLTRVEDPRPRLVVSAEATLGKPLAADPAATPSALVLVTADGRARALSARDLSPAGAWPLDAPLALPPAAVGGLTFLADTAGRVLALGPAAPRLWSADLNAAGHAGGSAALVAGAPAVRGDLVWFLAADGALHARSLADGRPAADLPLDVLPAGGPLAAGDDLYIPVGPGSLRRLTAEPERPGPAE